MRKKITLWFAAITLASTYATAIAEVLPKAGNITIQSIYKGTSMTKFTDGYTHGTITGVTFNEQGKGPLHMGKSDCSYSIFSHKKIIKAVGFCAYEDKNGDSIFIQYAGSSRAKGEWSGIDEIIGGTGKYKGIQGQGPYSCASTDKHSEFPCTTTLEYLLP